MESSEAGSFENSETMDAKSTNFIGQAEGNAPVPELHGVMNLRESIDEPEIQEEEIAEKVSAIQTEDESTDNQAEAGTIPPISNSTISDETGSAEQHSENHSSDVQNQDEASEMVSVSVTHEKDVIAKAVEVYEQASDLDTNIKEHRLSSGSNSPNIADSVSELENVKREVKMMETALQGAARQAQAKADEIAKLMNENEQLKAVIEDLKRKSNEAEIESLREEYHQRVAALERKVYALTKERDTLRREQSKKSDAAALLKEKDEIINQVMAEGVEILGEGCSCNSGVRTPYHLLDGNLARVEDRMEAELHANKFQLFSVLLDVCCLDGRFHGFIALLIVPKKHGDEGLTAAKGEELSKKQAAQESQIRKLRAQVEENKVDSIKRDKASTEKLLQETIEKHQAELASQKEYYTNALNAAKEAEALAEARANNEARTELECRLREAEERETMLVQTLEELRQTLSRKEQQVPVCNIEIAASAFISAVLYIIFFMFQAVLREDMLCRDIEDLQKRYQASERRCEELITQVPESTRPLLRQIEAMQETTARRAEAWAAVERSLNTRLQEAESKAAAAEEKERSINERLSQTLSRTNVLEAQISCLRAEQTQLTRSLEKERQKAAENRQEYLALKEESDTYEARVNQLEEELRELRRKHKQVLQEALTHQELLRQEVEREKAARLELERTARLQSSAVADQSPISKKSAVENGYLTRRLSSAGSLSSMEESDFLQASLDSSDSFSRRRNPGETTIPPYYMKSMTPSAFEATLRQREGELASYMSRLV
ncbi:unnamed protein product [Ilex paraguariensis]|uniref:Golgin candidate 5 n=1 Tax=Ilex paraguariensis TaxID=185542 RepID=A0ABC8UXM4_9AQUA